MNRREREEEEKRKRRGGEEEEKYKRRGGGREEEEETGTGELVVERRDREGGEGKGGQTKDVETNWRR